MPGRARFVAIVVNTNAGVVGGRGSPVEAARRAASEMTAPHNLYITSTLSELDKVCVELVNDVDCAAVAVAGGDGTLHHVLTRLTAVFLQRGVRLPPIVVLPLGTMNIVATALGLPSNSSSTLLRRAARCVESGRIPFVERRSLNINGEVGFIYGAGLPARILEMYYEMSGRPGFRVTKIIGSAMVGRISSQALKARATIEPPPPECDAIVAHDEYNIVMAGTVETVGFNFHLLPGAGRRDDAFIIRMSRLSALDLANQILVMREGGKLPRTDDHEARLVSLVFDDPVKFMVDGEIKPPCREHVVQLGPIIRFIIDD